MLASPVRGIWFDVGFYWPDGCSRLGVALAAVLHGYRWWGPYEVDLSL